MEQNSTSRPYNNTLSTFLDHVKQYLTTIPPVTKIALYTPIIICILDRIVFPLLSLQFDISSLISLNAVSFQVYRLVLYPFATNSFIQLFIIDIWLLPELYKLEKKQGSLRFLWILLVLFTIIPGIVYSLVMASITAGKLNTHILFVWDCRGMAGWVVGLVFWSYLEDEEDQQDRMIAGAIRMPKKMWPVLVFIFFIFLVQDASVFLNISAAIVGFLYAKGKLGFLVPSEDKFNEYESKSWLQFFTRSHNFVSIDSAGNSYLPIFMPTNANTPIRPSSSTNNNTQNQFPGQGVRLGS
ncbi:t-SNARE coiled-coil homology domain-containing protein [Mucor velutinosus]|uniref:t-SNARE coiled-coil homology domain-containing protein n=1 Tax=Mucor velutinosus TaxID=708070 RepID=A0AAN7D578_9FUNG|nr:t-SNARE coiled-coil homology domain-containing protein [Mucor velutinosus]